MSSSEWKSEISGNGQYASVNGLDVYYETHGSGRPIVLLHGGLGSGEMFGPVLALLAAERKVVLPDLQGHGRTALGERPFTLQAMGDDMAAIVNRLGHEQVDVLGPLKLTLSHNEGVAFGLADGGGVLLVAITLIALGVVLWLFARDPARPGMWVATI